MNPIIKPVRILVEKLQTILKVLMINPAVDKMEYFSSILVELKQLGDYNSRARSLLNPPKKKPLESFMYRVVIVFTAGSFVPVRY